MSNSWHLYSLVSLFVYCLVDIVYLNFRVHFFENLEPKFYIKE